MYSSNYHFLYVVYLNNILKQYPFKGNCVGNNIKYDFKGKKISDYLFVTPGLQTLLTKSDILLSLQSDYRDYPLVGYPLVK